MYEIGTKVVLKGSKRTGVVVDCLYEMDTRYEACEVQLEDGTKEWVSVDGITLLLNEYGSTSPDKDSLSE